MNLNKFRITTTKYFFKKGSMKLKICSLLMVNAEKWGAKIKK